MYHILGYLLGLAGLCGNPLFWEAFSEATHAKSRLSTPFQGHAAHCFYLQHNTSFYFSCQFLFVSSPLVCTFLGGKDQILSVELFYLKHLEQSLSYGRHWLGNIVDWKKIKTGKCGKNASQWTWNLIQFLVGQ